MRYFIFDTETTGFGDTDQVIQLAGVLLDEDFKIISAINNYCEINFPIPREATEVHGITNKMLQEMSEGCTIEDAIYESGFIEDEEDICFIAYNIDFDKRMINQSLRIAGMKEVDFGRSIKSLSEAKGRCNMCAMKTSASIFGYPRWIKLEQMFKSHSRYSIQNVENGVKSCNKAFNLPNVDSNFHDALYDSFVLTLLLAEHRNKFSI